MSSPNSRTPFGQWLKERRKALDITQEDLAERIGCARETIKKIEQGDRRPSRQIAELLARYFQIPEDEWEAFTHFTRSAPAGAPGESGSVSDDEKSAAPWREQRRHHTNLPIPPTVLLGRGREVAALRKLLLNERTRLVTLTGPPGIGKTRLALEVAESGLADHFVDGVYFVELAPISDPGLVPTTIAKALGLKESRGSSALESLQEGLSGKRMLLVLDNFEQVVRAAPDVAALLAAGPWLKVLVTSREPLRVRGERKFPVPLLDVPGTDERPDGGGWERIARYSAVALFVERAQEANPDFELTAENAGAVAAICARLDGLPLAIELVAARANIYSPQALLQQLSDRQVLHVGGLRDLPARQHTLHDAIGWSYELLDHGERVLLRRLGVFVGSFTAAAAEAVCNARDDLPTSAREAISSLFDKSLLQAHDDGSQGAEPRFTLLETIREYALAQLQQSGESDAVAGYHAEYFLALAEDAEPHITGPEQLKWADRLEAERDNLRAVLARSLSDGGKQSAGALPVWLALRLAGALGQFWGARGNLSEGRRWLQAAIEGAEKLTEAGLHAVGATTRDAHALDRVRLKALNAAGVLARLAGDFPAARQVLEGGLDISRRLGDRRAISGTLDNLGAMALMRGDYAEARSAFGESLAIKGELGLELEAGRGVTRLGNVALMEQDYPEARRLLEEGLAVGRRVEDRQGTGQALHSLAMVALAQGDYVEARRLDVETLSIARELGNRPGIAYSLRDLGNVAYELGDYQAARGSFLESLALFSELEDTLPAIECLLGVARVLARDGQHERAARLSGAAYAILESTEGLIDPATQARRESDLATLRAQLGEEAFAAAWNEGRTMSLDDALEEAARQE